MSGQPPPDLQKGLPCIATLREIVRVEEPRILIWDDGSSLAVQPRTVFEIMAVHAFLDEENRAGFIGKLEGGPLAFAGLAGFCHAVISDMGRSATPATAPPSPPTSAPATATPPPPPRPARRPSRGR